MKIIPFTGSKVGGGAAYVPLGPLRIIEFSPPSPPAPSTNVSNRRYYISRTGKRFVR